MIESRKKENLGSSDISYLPLPRRAIVGSVSRLHSLERDLSWQRIVLWPDKLARKTVKPLTSNVSRSEYTGTAESRAEAPCNLKTEFLQGHRTPLCEFGSANGQEGVNGFSELRKLNRRAYSGLPEIWQQWILLCFRPGPFQFFRRSENDLYDHVVGARVR